MGRRKWKRIGAVALAAALMLGGLPYVGGSQAVLAKENGVSYYIDAVDGNDDNDGTSPQQAWKTFAHVAELQLGAGDSLLLKAGCAWNDEKLEVSNAAGTAEQPVTIGSYGEGKKPVINGNGNAWLPAGSKNVSKQDAGVVHVYNSKNIIIENLEVTNEEGDAADLMGDTSEYDQSKYLLSGIVVENHDAGDLSGVQIRNNTVHHVNSFMKGGADKGAGGILALVTGSQKESSYKDLQITGNEVYDVCHEAIYMESSWAARAIVGGANSQDAGKNPWVGWKDIYVANNYVHHVAGDGIVLINADGGVAEYNLVQEAACEDWTYAGRNPAHAAIWMWDCDNVTMQYNEACFTESTQDGMAFDSDYGNQNILYQYNYSHDNKGGFYMSCPGPYYNANVVVRYNLSVNDGGSFNGARIIRVGEKGGIGNQIYNNTIYWDKDYEMAVVQQGSWGTPPSGGTEITNNIFYGNSSAAVTMTDNAGITYSNNAVYGNVASVYPAEDTHVVKGDAPFDASKVEYTTGTFADGKVTLGTVTGLVPSDDAATVDAGAYHPAVPEEALDAIADELTATQITAADKDYAQNAAPHVNQNGSAKVDIGAYESQAEGNLEPAGDVDKAYLNKLILQGKGYVQSEFAAAGWSAFQAALKDAEVIKLNEYASQSDVDASAEALAAAMSVLRKVERVESTAETGDNLVAQRNEDDSYDNVSFEAAGFNWGYWQASREISDAQAHSGDHSLKVDQTNGSQTGYSELGSVPVSPNEDYFGEAWVYCADSDVGSIGIEVKHHNSVTGGKGDIKLIQNVHPQATGADGWHQIRFTFTTQEYSTVSIAIGTDISPIYLDDVYIYEKYTTREIERPNYEKLDAALALAAEPEEAYTPDSWSAYRAAYITAKAKRVDAAASQDIVNQTAETLEAAYHALKKQEKEAAAVKKAPAAKTGLIADGSAQALVTAGEAAGGTLVYSLSENGSYTETIPTGREAGSYVVYYYAKGDSTHTDSKVASVKVTIAEKSGRPDNTGGGSESGAGTSSPSGTAAAVHTHSYSVNVTKAATCTEPGTRTSTCSCGDSRTETIPALGHKYTSKVTKEATTEAEGVRTYTCSRCGDSYTESISKKKAETQSVDVSVTSGGKTVKMNAGVSYQSEVTYTGSKITAKDLGLKLDLSALYKKVTIRKGNVKPAGLFKTTYVGKNNLHPTKKASMYARVSLNEKKAKKAGLKAAEVKALKKAVSAMNKSFAKNPCTYEINPVDLEADDAKVAADVTWKGSDISNVKGIQVTVSVNGAKKTLALKEGQYQIAVKNEIDKTVVITGQKDFTGVVVVKTK